MHRVVALFGTLAMAVAATPAAAVQCPGNPDALGTSRTLVVDPGEHPLIGGFQYRESLPLAHKEVVLTFDDGPLPPYSTRILDILARECVKATFFMVGRMAKSFPTLVKRTYAEGHTLANHSQNHPFNFHRMSLTKAAQEIGDSFDAIRKALGKPDGVAPFFRFPGLLRQDSVEQYLTSQGIMTWSVDFMADDWTRISSKEVVRRALMRLEAKGKGILLLHDIQPATALGLPELLRELKVRGYRIVHVVPATRDRPKTVTTAAQWRTRPLPTHTRTQRAKGMWPRIGPVRLAGPEPTLAAPSLTSFGAATEGSMVPVALVSTPEGLRADDREIPQPAGPQWPAAAPMADLGAAHTLPIPAAANFRYVEPFPGRAISRQARRPAASFADGAQRHIKKLVSKTRKSKQAKSKETKSKDTKSKDAGKPSRRAVGHQIQIPRPTASLPATQQAR